MGAAPSKDNEPIEEKGNTFSESELRRRRGSLQNNPHSVRNGKEDSEEKTQKVYIELHKFVLMLMVIVAALIGSVVGAQAGVSGSCKGIISGVLVGIILSKLMSIIHGNI